MNYSGFQASCHIISIGLWAVELLEIKLLLLLLLLLFVFNGIIIIISLLLLLLLCNLCFGVVYFSSFVLKLELASGLLSLHVNK
jgi:hypothetical protein